MDDLMEWQSATPAPSRAKRLKDPNWEQKQRAREYRVAARREKRNRKADEKKQRKLNATILRRMTRNPDKYSKNSERNRIRSIEIERRSIWSEALKQAQRLAAVHDPTGAAFNIGPVKTQEDGTVISLEALRRREERKAAMSRNEDATKESDSAHAHSAVPTGSGGASQVQSSGSNGLLLQGVKKLSKTQQKKLAAFEPRPPPPKPIIPEGIAILEGEENWLSLWDLSDGEIERRVHREKRRKAAARKALRLKQQSGKVERRAARDEKRRVYRDLKLTWKLIKEDEKRHKIKLKSAEDEEAKRIAVEISAHERQVALQVCTRLGLTLDSTPGVKDIRPRLLGMKGQAVDFDSLKIGDSFNDIKPKHAKTEGVGASRRVDLSSVPESGGAYVVSEAQTKSEDVADFIKLDVGEGVDFEALSYNHKLRRKIRRALENTQIRKELLVREQAREKCTEYGISIPAELSTPAKSYHERGNRLLPDGTLESEKSERVRLRLELAEFNKAARVLRKQAKEIAMEAGLRVHAEMTCRIPPRADVQAGYGIGWHVSSEPDPNDMIRTDDLALV